MTVFGASSDKYLSFIRKNKFKNSIIMLHLSLYIFFTTSVMCTGYAELHLKAPVCTPLCDDEHSNGVLGNCTFTCEVHLQEPLEVQFSFEISKKLSPGFLSEQWYKCDNGSKHCQKLNNTNYHIEKNFTVNSANLEDTFRCVLNQVNTTSNTRQFPNISDFRYLTRNLTINGHDGLTESNCTMEVTDNHINLDFVCNNPLPCVINISVNDQTHSQHTGRSKMSLDLINGKDMNVSLKYAPCSLDQNYTTINCRITSKSYDPVQSKTDSLTWAQENINIIVILCILANLVIVGAIFGVIFFKRRRRPCPERNNKQHTCQRSSTHRVGDVDSVVQHQENSPETFPLQEIDESVKHQQDPVYIGSSG